MLEIIDDNSKLLTDQLNAALFTSSIYKDQSDKLADFLMSIGYSVDDVNRIVIGIYTVN